MPSTVKQKIISFSAATAVTAALSSAFLTHAGAQDNAVPSGSPEIYSNDNAAEPPPANGPRIRALLQDLSGHPLAGGPISIEICSDDALGSRDCDIITAELPLPKLSNPVGYEVQHLRRALAYGLEQAERGEDNKPLPAEIQRVGMEVADQFETFLDKQSTEFPKFETLITMMDMHYDLIQIAQARDLEKAEAFIGDLRNVILKLEDDLLTDAEKALQDIQARIKDALTEGASGEEFGLLTEEALKAMEKYLEELKENRELTEEEKEALEKMQQLVEELKKLMDEMGISPADLAQMMQQMIEGMSGSGGGGDSSLPSCAKMLEQVQQQMDFIKTHLKTLDDITQLQQKLRDEILSETLRKERGSQPEDSAFENSGVRETSADTAADQGKAAPETLEERQQDIRKHLNDMIEDMKNKGADTSSLSKALKEMDQAIDDLELGRESNAIEDQDEALEILKQNSDQMKKMLMFMFMMCNPIEIPSSGGNSSDSDGDELRGESGILDENGRLRGPSNRNHNLGISPDAEDNRSQKYRDKILERQRQQNQNQGGNDYLDRLLDGPDGP